MGHSSKTQAFLTESRMRDAMAGDSDACFELGVSFSAGVDGCDLDLIQAHMWFNLAAVRGNDRAVEARHEVSEEMSAREIVEAQKMARALLYPANRLAA